jgi:hypothetical protein
MKTVIELYQMATLLPACDALFAAENDKQPLLTSQKTHIAFCEGTQ